MKPYREVKASDRLPTEEELYFVYYKGDNDQYYKHLLLYDDGEWMDSYTGKPWDDFNGIWLEPYNITEDELNNIIQPHAITLEHGEKAVKEIIEYLKGE